MRCEIITTSEISKNKSKNRVIDFLRERLIIRKRVGTDRSAASLSLWWTSGPVLSYNASHHEW